MCSNLTWLILFIKFSSRLPGPVRHHHVRCDLTRDLQECAQLASGPGARLREYPHRAHGKQGGHQGPQGQGQEHRLPPEEEPPVLRHFRQVKL